MLLKFQVICCCNIGMQKDYSCVAQHLKMKRGPAPVAQWLSTACSTSAAWVRFPGTDIHHSVSSHAVPVACILNKKIGPRLAWMLAQSKSSSAQGNKKFILKSLGKITYFQNQTESQIGIQNQKGLYSKQKQYQKFNE